MEAVNQALNLQKEYFGKLEKLQNNLGGNRQEQIRKLQAEIAKLEEQIKLTTEKDKIQLLEQEKTKKQTELQILLKSDDPSIDIEAKKKELYQEYQQKFQKITFSITKLTTEILTNLNENGYNLTKIIWTGELQSPSLTTEPAVEYSTSKNK